MESDFDCSWIIDEENRYNNINYRENMNSIQCYFIYIDSNSNILKIIKETEYLVDISNSNSNTNSKFIHNDRLLHIIQNKKILDSGQRFKISNLVKFVVDIEPEKLDYFNGLRESELKDLGFLKEVNIFGNIIIEPSMFCFHKVASLYFFLREDEMLVKPIRSILKVKKDNNRTTKKVRIFEDIPDNFINTDLLLKNNKTKKFF
jgi:hypothetical protein